MEKGGGREVSESIFLRLILKVMLFLAFRASVGDSWAVHKVVCQ